MNKIKTYKQFVLESLEDEKEQIADKIASSETKEPTKTNTENPEDILKMSNNDINDNLLKKIETIEINKAKIKDELTKLDVLLKDSASKGLFTDKKVNQQLEDRKKALDQKIKDFDIMIQKSKEESVALNKK